MRVLIFTLLILSLCLPKFCTAQEKPVANDYTSCCGTQPVEFAYEKQKIYVPNVFTPNGDGINDYFMPYINEEVGAVWGFTIYSAKGDTILYQREYFNYSKEEQNYAWNGLRRDGSQYAGLFKYEMRVDDKKANKHLVTGYACAIVCGPDTKIFKTKEGCFYPSQANKGSIDKSIASKEKDCF